ncbi:MULTISPECIES: nucleotide exchange factor GrpE [unclassified Spirosoma]|uniref:nucleotide exchange factor GrpE n=1 Tax=unclassified Spirosoma TaxID=2621999 RepID=UPI00095D36E8|nr:MULTISPECIES: nucleotide exchange factor GrpE [unclassified Spirosoma]MBN8825532.1 nucleotide exchange factor GrpE [Spirosoma sp.]OJW74216.1 MAG: nucleotide exchange factor GrpE [Spirosoma sp. 48-14]
MENKDILDEQASMDTPQPDNLTNEEAVTVNGGETEDPKQTAPADDFIAETNRIGSELAELKDKYLRLYADFENFRRRTAKEKLDLIGNANESVLQSMIPVVDDFERALQSIDKTDDVAAVKEGVSLIYNKLFKTLESKGLKPMVSKGEPFNADLHESVTQFPAPSEDLKGKVIDEIEKGYYLNDKVIRFAKVIVGS